MRKFEYRQITNDLSCMEWNSNNRCIRKFQDGHILWHFHGIISLSVDYRVETSTGTYWTVRASYYPDLKDQHNRIEVWVNGETRKEAFKKFRLKLKGYQEFLQFFDSKK